MLQTAFLLKNAIVDLEPDPSSSLLSSLYFPVFLSVSRMTHERVDRCQPNMAGMAKEVVTLEVVKV